ncbi:MAG: peptidyl-prolyl cis-trans isomerase [Paracoccaceae bacterium]
MSAAKKKSAAKTTGNFVVWAILLLLIVGLGGFGVRNFGGRVQSIGQVGDTDISVDEYARELTQAMRQAEQQSGQPMTIAQAEAQGIVARARGRVITSATLDNEVSKMGVSVGDAEVQKQVLGYDAFKGQDGKFSRDAYSYALQQNGLTEAGFEAQIRKESARSLLQGAIVAGVSAPAAYGDVIYDYIGARRSYSMIELKPADLDTPVGQPDDAALKAYYDAHPDDFTAPASKSITYAWLTPNMMMDKVQVDEKTLKDLYQQRIDEFVQPERRLVERLVYPSEAEAQAAKRKLDSGEATFEDLVAARGLELSDIDLGDVTKADLGPAGDAVFALTEPGVAGPVQTDLGPALIRMNAILDAQKTTFAEARDDLKSELAQERARRMISDDMSGIDDKLAAGATLEDLANETDMQLGQIDYFDGQDADIAAYDAFRSAAESAQEGDFPEVVQLDDGGIFALRVDGTAPAHLRPLDEVRSKAVRDWRTAEITRRLTEKADALKAQLDEGKTIQAMDLPVETADAVTRGGVTPPALSKTVFNLDKGKSAVVSGPDGVFLVQVDDILPPDPQDKSASFLKDQLKQQAGQGISQDLFTYFAQSLLDDAGLTLNQAAINAVHAQVR